MFCVSLCVSSLKTSINHAHSLQRPLKALITRSRLCVSRFLLFLINACPCPNSNFPISCLVIYGTRACICSYRRAHKGRPIIKTIFLVAECARCQPAGRTAIYISVKHPLLKIALTGQAFTARRPFKLPSAQKNK